jgi:hypothetical protein
VGVVPKERTLNVFHNTVIDYRGLASRAKEFCGHDSSARQSAHLENTSLRAQVAQMTKGPENYDLPVLSKSACSFS